MERNRTPGPSADTASQPWAYAATSAAQRTRVVAWSQRHLPVLPVHLRSGEVGEDRDQVVGLDRRAERRPVVDAGAERGEDGLAGAQPEQVRPVGPEQPDRAGAVVARGQHQVAAPADHGERPAAQLARQPARLRRPARPRPPGAVTSSSLP